MSKDRELLTNGRTTETNQHTPVWSSCVSEREPVNYMSVWNILRVSMDVL